MRHQFLKFFFLLIVGGFPFLSAQAQGTLNANPPSLKWYYLTTPHFKILFPENNDSLAQHTANLMETLYGPVSHSLGTNPKPISVILQNQTTISNGFVSYSPRRTEFFTAPPQDYNFLGTNQWNTLLAVHEFRHVAQFSTAHHGWNRLNYWLGGEAGFGGLSFLVLPSWFWEGDAVGIETACTPSGRGRIPEFNMAFRTTLLERGPWNYSKQYLRSYKHFVPNHYVTGYYLTTYVREQTQNPHIWEAVEKRAVNFPYLPFRMGWALKKETGTNLNRTYKNMVDSLAARWQAQLEGLTFTEATRINPRREKREVYTNYRYPQALGDGQVLVQKSGLGDIAQLVVMDGQGQQERVHYMGIVSGTQQLTVGGGKVAWIEHEFHPRYTSKDYAVVRLLDLATQERSTLARETRDLAVAINPEGSQVVTITVDTEGRQALRRLRAETNGALIDSLPLALGHQAAMPRWSPDGKAIYYLLTEGMGQKSLVKWDLATGTTSYILAPSNENLGYPVPWSHYVLYNSPYSGIDNIYAVDTRDGSRYQVTSRKYGAFNPNPSPDGRTLYFNDYTFYGYDAVSMPLDPSTWTALANVDVRIDDTYQVWVEQEKDHLPDLESIPEETYTKQPVKGITPFLNPYAWGVSVQDGSAGEAQLGLFFQDELSTLRTGLTYGYDQGESTPQFGLQVSLQKYYPIFDFKLGTNQRVLSRPQLQADSSVLTEIIQWNERRWGLDVRVPFILTQSQWLQQAGVSAGYEQIAINNFGSTFNPPTLNPRFEELHSVHYAAYYTVQRRQAQRDLAPRLGFLTQARAYHLIPPTSGLKGWLAGNTTVVYLPGIGKHHSLQVVGSAQWQYAPLTVAGQYPASVYGFQSPFTSIVRGYVPSRTQQFYAGSIRYSLPILYPDLALWHLAYIQRITATAWGDLGHYIHDVAGTPLGFTQTAAGIDINLDVNGMRYLPQFNVGVRGGYAFENTDSPWIISLLLSGSPVYNF